MGTETNAINRGSYCREVSVGKVKCFSVYFLRFCVSCVSLPRAWVVPGHARFMFGEFCGFLNISSRMLDDLILNLHHLLEIDLLYNSQVILNYVLFVFGATAPNGPGTPPMGQGLLTHEVSRSHTTTHHSR